MHPRYYFTLVLLVVLFSMSEVGGDAIISSPEDVNVTVHQNIFLYCTASCSHVMKWRTNYRNQRTITVHSQRPGMNVYEVADGCDSPLNPSNHTQVLEIDPVTPEWHGKAVQCRAVPMEDGSVDFSRFATIYVHGIDINNNNVTDPCDWQSHTPAETMNVYTSSSKPIAHVTQLLQVLFILVNCFILL